MNEERRERGLKLRVGIFVVGALVLLLGMVYLLGARAALFEPRYTVHADFTEVGGLTEGATVRLAGVQIGRVTDVRLPGEPGGKVRVDLTIGRQYAGRVRRDSVARIETQGLLGDKIVEVSVGTRQAPAARPGDVLPAREPFDIGQVVNETTQIVRSVGALAESLRQTAETLNQSRLIEDAAATVTTARRTAEQIGRDVTATTGAVRGVTEQAGRLVEQVGRDVTAAAGVIRGVAEQAGRIADRAGRIVERVEQGPGWAHTLLYDEPVALRKLNELLTTTEALLDKVQRGEGAVGVLTSAESTAAARRFVAAMQRLGQMLDRPPAEEGVLPALLFDPQYRAVLDDLRTVARNFREVSERVAGGRGTLGSLVKDEPEEGGIRQASRDFQAAMANLKVITDKLNEGEGTLGALIADPTIYERLAAILEGAQRSFLLRGLLRGLGAGGDRARDGERPGEGEGPGGGARR